MTDYHWARNCSTKRLNELLDPSDPEGRGVDNDTFEALLAEKDRRLADPNSPDFRPQFN